MLIYFHPMFIWGVGGWVGGKEGVENSLGCRTEVDRQMFATPPRPRQAPRCNCRLKPPGGAGVAPPLPRSSSSPFSSSSTASSSFTRSWIESFWMFVFFFFFNLTFCQCRPLDGTTTDGNGPSAGIVSDWN